MTKRPRTEVILTNSNTNRLWWPCKVRDMLWVPKPRTDVMTTLVKDKLLIDQGQKNKDTIRRE